MVEFDPASHGERDIYKLLTGSVVPRPIALVTSLDEADRVNAAPFSFFNVLGFDPPILALGIESRSGAVLKDTAANIRARNEFVVNTVSFAMAEAMNACAADYSSGISEPERAGLAQTPSSIVAVPRLVDSPASFECRRYVALELGQARTIILGEVVRLHLRADVVDPETFRVDTNALDLIGRLGGHGYVRLTDTFDMVRPSAPPGEAFAGEPAR